MRPCGRRRQAGRAPPRVDATRRRWLLDARRRPACGCRSTDVRRRCSPRVLAGRHRSAPGRRAAPRRSTRPPPDPGAAAPTSSCTASLARHHVRQEPAMLISLLREHLRPYRPPSSRSLVLQLVQTIATLYLPSLNADIIDDGVAQGDTAEILRLGGIMLARQPRAGDRRGRRRLLRRADRDGVRAGRAQAAVRARADVLRAGGRPRSARPSLITRTTNDVQQVQMVVLHDVHHDDHGADHARRRRRHGPAGGRRAVRRCCWSSCPVLGVVVGLIVTRMIPHFRPMQKRIDAINRVLREQITGVRVIRAFVRERRESERFAGREHRPATTRRCASGKLMALMFPSVMLVHERDERRGAVVRRAAHRRRATCRSGR